jgi:hypothetical protein
MRNGQPRPGGLSSLFLPIFIGGLCGWILPYLLFKAPILGNRFLDGVIGLVLCGIVGGVIGAIIQRR